MSKTRFTTKSTDSRCTHLSPLEEPKPRPTPRCVWVEIRAIEYWRSKSRNRLSWPLIAVWFLSLFFAVWFGPEPRDVCFESLIPISFLNFSVISVPLSPPNFNWFQELADVVDFLSCYLSKQMIRFWFNFNWINWLKDQIWLDPQRDHMMVILY